MFGLAGLVARHVRLPSPSCASSSCCLVLPSPPCGLRCFFLELPGERERRCPTIGKGLLLLRVHFLWPCNGQSHVVLGPPARLPLGGGKGRFLPYPTLPVPLLPAFQFLSEEVGGVGHVLECGGRPTQDHGGQVGGGGGKGGRPGWWARRLLWAERGRGEGERDGTRGAGLGGLAYAVTSEATVD